MPRATVPGFSAVLASVMDGECNLDPQQWYNHHIITSFDTYIS